MADDMSCSSQNSITPTAQNKPDQNDGRTMNFKISGSANQVIPIQANRNSGKILNTNNSYEATVGNPTRDIPIGTGRQSNP